MAKGPTEKDLAFALQALVNALNGSTVPYGNVEAAKQHAISVLEWYRTRKLPDLPKY